MRKRKKAFLSAIMAGSLAIGIMSIPASSFAANGVMNNSSNKPQVQTFHRAQQMGAGLYMRQYFQGNMHEVIAEQLGMTSEELYSERLAGKTIAQLLEEKGVAPEEIVNAVLAEREESLKEMVEANKITEEQKDFLLNRMKTMVENMVTTDNIGAYGNGNRSGNAPKGSCFMIPRS